MKRINAQEVIKRLSESFPYRKFKLLSKCLNGDHIEVLVTDNPHNFFKCVLSISLDDFRGNMIYGCCNGEERCELLGEYDKLLRAENFRVK